MTPSLGTSLLILLTASAVEAGCPSKHPAGEEQTDLVSGVKGMTCTDVMTTWKGRGPIVLAYCQANGEWEPSDVACTSLMSKRRGCSDPPPVPANTKEKHTFKDDNKVVYGVYYTCDKLAWLSGEPGRLTQCVDGVWSAVLDSCEEDCEFPRDCYAISFMGLVESGIYVILPSGDSSDSTVQVYCDLNDTTVPGGSGWTNIFRHYSGLQDFNDLQFSDFLTTIGSAEASEESSYFIGLEALAALNRKPDGKDRPGVEVRS
ncbi:uncharacterized protein LOC121873879 [Homarus americanus]|uniref:uncharacterized protein LOC121873879 n=1 Tax=Homarus americanus TaxID=6706 RepID=UPI001C4592DB|nr:uncharacterized protein LOC121873879 [Homarus americanus]